MTDAPNERIPDRDARELGAITAPNGSRWYLGGEHYVVERQTHKEGEPAVEIRLLRSKKKFRKTIITRLLLRGASRQEDD